MLDTSQGHSPVFRQTSRAPMALAPGIRTPSAFDQAMHQFGARLFEAAPGLVTWVLLLAPAWIPIIFPWPGAFVVAGGVLLFDVYWLGRSATVVTGVGSTLSKMLRLMRIDLLARCYADQAKGLHDPLQYIHLYVIPTYTEPYHVLEQTVQAIVDAKIGRAHV